MLKGSAALTNGEPSAADTLAGTPKTERATVPPQTRPLPPAGTRQHLSWRAVTFVSALILLLFAYASPGTLRVVAATSVVWAVAVWRGFYT